MSNYNITDLADNLDYINNTKLLIRNAIIDKGQSVDINTPFRNYVDSISNISSGESVNSYLFSNMSAMNSFSSSAENGDYGVVYSTKNDSVNRAGVYTNLHLEPTVAFLSPITSWINNTTNSNSNASNVFNYNIGPNRIILTHKASKIGGFYNNFYYDSNDGKNYVFNPYDSNDINLFYGLNINIVNYVPQLSNILFLPPSVVYNGIFTYNSNSNLWMPVNTQLNAEVTNILNGKVAYVNDKLTGTLFNSEINGLNNGDVKYFSVRTQPILTNISIDGFISTKSLFAHRKDLYLPPIKSSYLYWTFYNCINLLYANIETTNDINTSLAFYNCTNLVAVYGNITLCDNKSTSVFNNCTNLVKLPNIIVNGNNLIQTFYNCRNLVDLSVIDSSNIYLINNAFYGIYNIDILNTFDFSNVESVSGLLGSVPNGTPFSKLNLLNIKTLNFNKLKSVGYLYMYSGLSAFPNWTYGNIDIPGMFYHCVNLTTVPTINMYGVKNITCLFCGCNNLTTIPNWDTSNIEVMSSVFSSCSNLTNIPNWDTSNCVNLYAAFSGCYNLTTVPNWNTTKVNSMYDVFWNCYNLIALPNWDTSNVTSLGRFCMNCVNLVTVPNWDISNCVTFTYAFVNCSNVISFPNWNTTKVKNLWGSFYNCRKITSVPKWNLSNALNLDTTFAYCVNLVTVPQFNVVNVVNLDSTFLGCNNLSNASVQNIINMCLNSNVTNIRHKNLMVNNSYSPFYNTKFNNSYYSNRLTQLSAAGWTY